LFPKAFLFLFFALLIPITASWSMPLYPFDSPRQKAQFESLLKELRCLVCQNQDLADSNAGLAKDLREIVYKMVRDGQSDQEITQYLTNRYGDFILFKPPVKGFTFLLWLGPILFLIGGFIIFWRTCWSGVTQSDGVNSNQELLSSKFRKKGKRNGSLEGRQR
jgi:cytochrome c-type biogenesis protein CcmH